MSRLLKPVLCFCLLLAMASGAFAQMRRISVFINGAGYIPAEKSLLTGYGSGMGGVFHLNPRLAISFEWKYSRFSVDQKEGGLLDGTLAMTPLVASLLHKIRVSETVSLYPFAGGGFFISSFRLNEQAILPETNVRRQEVKNGMGLYGGIGSAIKLNARLSLFIEGLYLRRTAEAETVYLDNSPPTTFKINLSSFSILIGLSYFY